MGALEWGRLDIAEERGTVRAMTLKDLDRIMSIEQASFATPWSLASFISELKDNEYARYFCLELNGRIVGYMGLWLILEEGHITNVAIAPNYRGQGWGEYLMGQVIRRVLPEGMERLTLEVRVSNEPALQLYKRLGFQQAGVRRRYYSDNQEDAIIMWLDLKAEGALE